MSTDSNSVKYRFALIDDFYKVKMVYKNDTFCQLSENDIKNHPKVVEMRVNEFNYLGLNFNQEDISLKICYHARTLDVTVDYIVK